MMPSLKDEIDKVFDLLDHWRNLPDYQLERRADIYFAIYLNKILEGSLGCQVVKVIPEFPVWKGTINPEIKSNHSLKIDYMVICKDKTLFVELKTDDLSRRTEQDENLKKAQEVNIKNLIDGLLQINQNTKSNKKYLNLLNEFKEIAWLKEENEVWENSSQDTDIEIIYIQPTIKEKNKEEDKKYKTRTISFEEIANILVEINSDLSKRFAESLRKWTKGPGVTK